MGKRGRNRRADVGVGMDQHGERNGPDRAERRGLSLVGKSDLGEPGRDADAATGGDDHSLSLDQSDVREPGKRLRLHWGPKDALDRSFDAKDINAVLNSAEVFNWVAGPNDTVLDAGPLLEDHRNILLTPGNHMGGLIFVFCEPGIYEVHNNWLSIARGQYAHCATLAALRWMFTRTEAMMILTRVPAFNRPAAQLAAAVGGVKEFERAKAYPTKDGPVDVSFWSLRYEDWVRRTPALAEVGKMFHVKLHAEVARLGGSEEHHPDEECHDRAVGAAFEMVYAGQVEKGVWLYNRWARWAGYQQIALVAKEPLLINIGNALLQVVGDTFKVIRCL